MSSEHLDENPASCETPILRHRDIICLSLDDWDKETKLSRRHIFPRLSKTNRVLFVNRTGVRNPTWRDLPTLLKKLKNCLWDNRRSLDQDLSTQNGTGLWVVTPLVIPFHRVGLFRRINTWILRRFLKSCIEKLGFKCPIFWTYIPFPWILDAIRPLEPALIVYHAVDYRPHHKSVANPERFRQEEIEYLSQVDLVFCSARGLVNVNKAYNHHIYFTPNAVDIEQFARGPEDKQMVPQDLRHVPRPIIGTMGMIHEWVDQDLLTFIAGARPEWSIVLIGPERMNTSKLKAFPNIYLLGRREHEQLPGYVVSFDVCLIPYVVDTYTTYTFPSKLFEFMASGKPIVSTDLPEVRPYVPYVRIAQNREVFVEEIEACLEEGPDPAPIQKRCQIATEVTWSNVIQTMSLAIETRLDNRA